MADVWLTLCACALVHTPMGLQVLYGPGAITDSSLSMLFISSHPPPSCSALQSNIPHTPLELRERPAVRQGTSSGMSLLSQGEKMEGGREQEVRPEGPTFVRLTPVMTVGIVAVSILSFDHYTELRFLPLVQSERIGM